MVRHRIPFGTKHFLEPSAPVWKCTKATKYILDRTIPTSKDSHPESDCETSFPSKPQGHVWKVFYWRGFCGCFQAAVKMNTGKEKAHFLNGLSGAWSCGEPFGAGRKREIGNIYFSHIAGRQVGLSVFVFWCLTLQMCWKTGWLDRIVYLLLSNRNWKLQRKKKYSAWIHICISLSASQNEAY